MPRQPDAPCAGGCGRLLWGGSGSLPAGERTCRACRKAGSTPAVVTQPCGTCGTPVTRIAAGMPTPALPRVAEGKEPRLWISTMDVIMGAGMGLALGLLLLLLLLLTGHTAQ